MNREHKTFIGIMCAVIIAAVIALPESVSLQLPGRDVQTISLQRSGISLFGRTFGASKELKKGLDIQGGMQVVLQADMSSLDEIDREVALESAREIILRRVDLYGVSEPLVQTSRASGDYRLIVELPGVENPDEALSLVGQTAQLSFQLVKPEAIEQPLEATEAALVQQSIVLEPTGLDGAQLKRSQVQFDPTTGEPVVGLEFTAEGQQLFADITRDNIGQQLAIVLDGVPLMAPVIQSEIINGQATITGGFNLETAQELSIQLNAGALPVPITVLEQRTIGASLGELAIQQSVQAGVIGIGLVMVFMILVYGMKGVLASIALVMYAIFTVALYKIFSVTLTLPGIAGLLLSIGMAVDANILIFERMKEELRLGRPFERALDLGFGRAWDSIKDANIATIMTALVLINPLDFSFLNTSGLVRGFGTTLLIGVLLSLFTGVVVSRTLLQLFLKPQKGVATS